MTDLPGPIKVWRNYDPTKPSKIQEIPYLLPTAEQFQNYRAVVQQGEALDEYQRFGAFMIRVPPLVFGNLLRHQARIEEMTGGDYLLTSVSRQVGVPVGYTSSAMELNESVLLLDKRDAGPTSLSSLAALAEPWSLGDFKGTTLDPEYVFPIGSDQVVSAEIYMNQEQQVGHETELPPYIGPAKEPVALNPDEVYGVIQSFQTHWSTLKGEEVELAGPNYLYDCPDSPDYDEFARTCNVPAVKSISSDEMLVDLARPYATDVDPTENVGLMELFCPTDAHSRKQTAGRFQLGALWDFANLPNVLHSLNWRMDTDGTMKSNPVLAGACPGVKTPWFYMGVPGTFFTNQTEDMFFSAVNLLIKGASKIWFLVQPDQAPLVEKFARERCEPETWKRLFGECKAPMRHKMLWLDPNAMLAAGIEVRMVVQRLGDILYLAPRTYHGGVNTGFNVALSVNVVPRRGWIDIARVVTHCTCRKAVDGSWCPACDVQKNGKKAKDGRALVSPAVIGIDFSCDILPFMIHLLPHRVEPWIWGDDLMVLSCSGLSEYIHKDIIRFPPVSICELQASSCMRLELDYRIAAVQSGNPIWQRSLFERRGEQPDERAVVMGKSMTELTQKPIESTQLNLTARQGALLDTKQDFQKVMEALSTAQKERDHSILAASMALKERDDAKQHVSTMSSELVSLKGELDGVKMALDRSKSSIQRLLGVDSKVALALQRATQEVKSLHEDLIRDEEAALKEWHGMPLQGGVMPSESSVDGSVLSIPSSSVVMPLSMTSTLATSMVQSIALAPDVTPSLRGILSTFSTPTIVSTVTELMVTSNPRCAEMPIPSEVPPEVIGDPGDLSSEGGEMIILGQVMATTPTSIAMSSSCSEMSVVSLEGSKSVGPRKSSWQLPQHVLTPEQLLARVSRPFSAISGSGNVASTSTLQSLPPRSSSGLVIQSPEMSTKRYDFRDRTAKREKPVTQCASMSDVEEGHSKSEKGKRRQSKTRRIEVSGAKHTPLPLAVASLSSDPVPGPSGLLSERKSASLIALKGDLDPRMKQGDGPGYPCSLANLARGHLVQTLQAFVSIRNSLRQDIVFVEELAQQESHRLWIEAYRPSVPEGTICKQVVTSAYPLMHTCGFLLPYIVEVENAPFGKNYNVEHEIVKLVKMEASQVVKVAAGYVLGWKAYSSILKRLTMECSQMRAWSEGLTVDELRKSPPEFIMSSNFRDAVRDLIVNLLPEKLLRNSMKNIRISRWDSLYHRLDVALLSFALKALSEPFPENGVKVDNVTKLMDEGKIHWSLPASVLKKKTHLQFVMAALQHCAQQYAIQVQKGYNLSVGHLALETAFVHHQEALNKYLDHSMEGFLSMMTLESIDALLAELS